MPSTLEFEAVPLNGSIALVPTIDGESLVDLITFFESQRAWDAAGEYAGIVPEDFNFGDLTLYYEARADRQRPQPGHAWLLGCDCGEVGCWPLTARITVSQDEVTWSDFSQQFRPERNYDDFGPFVFDRGQYAHAVAAAAEAVATD